MFKKLVKHEFIASYRSYLPIYLAIIVFSFVTPLTRQIDVIQLTSAATTILGILIGAVFFFTLYNVIISVGKRVYGKPGYLLFATPASAHQIILSKLLVNVIWVMLSGMTTIIAILGFLLALDITNFRDIFAAVLEIIKMFWNTGLIAVFVTGVSYLVYSILLIMLTFAVTNAVYKGQHKILVGFAMYFIIAQVTGIITSLISVGPLLVIFGSENIAPSNLLWFFPVIYLGLAIGFYFLVHYFVDKRLELQ